MATPVPPPSPRHLRLLRLLLSGLILGTALNGATARRPGKRALWAQAVGCSGVRVARQGILPPGAALVFLATALALPRPTGQAGPVRWAWIG